MNTAQILNETLDILTLFSHNRNVIPQSIYFITYENNLSSSGKFELLTSGISMVNFQTPMLSILMSMLNLTISL